MNNVTADLIAIDRVKGLAERAVSAYNHPGGRAAWTGRSRVSSEQATPTQPS